MEALIRSGLVQLGQAQAVPQEAPTLLARYGKLLVEKNQVMNLTAITDPQDVATLHMLDCAALLNCAGFAGKSLIDVGTGAGFPGLALKILVPSLETTLLDSLNKRVDWLNETIDALGLEGAQAIHGRAEEAAREPDLRLLCELCLPFVKTGGRFLAMKGTDCGQELNAALPAIQILGAGVEGIFDYQIPHTNVTHRIILIQKTAPTPEKYPRRWAKIQKSPL